MGRLLDESARRCRTDNRDATQKSCIVYLRVYFISWYTLIDDGECVFICISGQRI